MFRKLGTLTVAAAALSIVLLTPMPARAHWHHHWGGPFVGFGIGAPLYNPYAYEAPAYYPPPVYYSEPGYAAPPVYGSYWGPRWRFHRWHHHYWHPWHRHWDWDD